MKNANCPSGSSAATRVKLLVVSDVFQFSKAFKEINKNLNIVFQKLFGGGECGMKLMDDEDILDCGIDVIAQPPGKRLQNILLLLIHSPIHLVEIIPVIQMLH